MIYDMKKIYYLYIGLVLILIAVLLSCTKYADMPTETRREGIVSNDKA